MAPVYDWILEASGANRESAVFDEGCGSGMLYRRAKERGGGKPFRNYLGIDSNQKVLDEAKKHGVEHVMADFAGGMPSALDPTRMENKFTHYYAVFPKHASEGAVRTAGRLLKAGGKYVVLGPRGREEPVPEELGGVFKLVKTEHRELGPEQLKVLQEHEPAKDAGWGKGLMLIVYEKK
jgi:SAM-dependent methyltransferase